MKVKLIYWLKVFVEGCCNVEKNLQIMYCGGEVYLKNLMLYYFVVIGVKLNGQLVRLNDRVMNEIVQLVLKSEVVLGKLLLNGMVMVQVVNDWGGIQDYMLK